MGLGGGGADEQALGDLGVGQAGPDEGGDLSLACWQFAQARDDFPLRWFGLGEEASDQGGGGCGGQQRLSGGNGPDALEQVCWVDPLAEIAAGSCAQA